MKIFIMHIFSSSFFTYQTALIFFFYLISTLFHLNQTFLISILFILYFISFHYFSFLTFSFIFNPFLTSLSNISLILMHILFFIVTSPIFVKTRVSRCYFVSCWWQFLLSTLYIFGLMFVNLCLD